MATMAAEPSSSSPPATSSGNLITSTNHNDILMGRGTRSNEFIGNQRFRSIVEQRKDEYMSAHKNKAKQEVARKIIDQIHALGGRFLKEVENETPVNDDDGGIWCEVEEKVALEKCKQALRQQQRERQRASNEDESLERNVNYLASPADSLPQSSAGLANRAAVAPPSPLSRVQGDPTTVPMLSPNVHFVLPSTLDEHLILFPSTTLALQQPVMMNRFYPSQLNQNYQIQNGLGAPPWVMHAPTVIGQQGLLPDMHRIANEAAESTYQSFVQDSASLQDSAIQGLLQLRTDNVAYQAGRISSDTRSTESYPSSGQDASAQAVLSLLEDRPRFTEEQEEAERAAMTDEERAAALTDLFGKQCVVDAHKSKRARRDLDHNAIEFLVNQMRLEIERIPEEHRRALREAQMKCRADEFSDARMERFLRCEGMNVKLGAQRFVDYWESRQEVFGPEKFVLRMTLSEALCDDLAALKACVVRPLPHLDASGRQLLLLEPRRHTREGYTSESMLRTVWYVFELMAQENADMESGFVLVQWLKDTTVWDYDRGLYDRLIYFDKSCWPVKRMATHLCCPPWIHVKIILPIVNTVTNKHTRSRKLVHDVPGDQLLDVLSDYGIRKEMLPTEMGGTVQLDHAEWIANLRAAELAEI